MSRFLSIVIAGTLIAGLSACDTQSGGTAQAPDNSGQQKPPPPPHPALSGVLDISKRGEVMPDAPFTAPDGTSVTLAEFKGKPLLVNLWATWCAPCVVEMPTLDDLAKKERERLKVLTISQDNQGKAKVGPFFEKGEFSDIEPYLDTQNNLGFAYATGVMPTTILYDADGNEVWRVLGGMNWNGPRAAALMEETLAAK